MAVVYVIQVIAYHGGGIKGWRTVRKPSGAVYGFQTRAAAEAALQQHFGNLRDGLTVRVHAMAEEAAQRPMPEVPPEPPSSSTPAPQHRSAEPCP